MPDRPEELPEREEWARKLAARGGLRAVLEALEVAEKRITSLEVHGQADDRCIADLENRLRISEQKASDLQALLDKFRQEEEGKTNRTMRGLADQVAELREQLQYAQLLYSKGREERRQIQRIVDQLPKCENACSEPATGMTGEPDSEYRCDAHARAGGHHELPYATALREYRHTAKKPKTP